MDANHDIPDSTDWLNTPLSGLASLENALHCQICKEFFDTPMITSCSHTFCSKCIRTALSTDGCCPACRAQDQASKLRNNWQLQEVVTQFLEARPATIKVAREQTQAAEAAAQRPGKRKRVVLDSDIVESGEPVGRTTRSKSRKTTSSQTSQPEVIEVDDTDDEAFIPVEETQDDGLVECPLGCGQRMKIEQVEPHLDRCEGERVAREKAAAWIKKPPMAARPQDRLNELNYSMMKEKDLIRKMKDLGIPTTGSKQLMVRRHTAWVNIWNANCDSSNPRTKRELLRELDTWERTQGGNAPNVTNGIMKKDFDGSGWSKKNQDDFSKLIANARRTKAKASDDSKGEEKSVLPTPDSTNNAMDSQPPSDDIPLEDSLVMTSANVEELDTATKQHNPASDYALEANLAVAMPDNVVDQGQSQLHGPSSRSQMTPAKRLPMFVVPEYSASAYGGTLDG